MNTAKVRKKVGAGSKTFLVYTMVRLYELLNCNSPSVLVTKSSGGAADADFVSSFETSLLLIEKGILLRKEMEITGQRIGTYNTGSS